MPKKYHKIKDKATIGPKKKNFGDLTHESKLSRIYYEKHPERHQQKLKRQSEYYVENKPKIAKQKAELRRKRSLKVIKLLGGKCVSCGEPLDINPKIPNLQLHHLEYDEDDLRKKARYGKSSGAVQDAFTMAKNGKNPKEKYVLLCIQCHEIETFSHQNPKKTFDMLSWMLERGIFDEVLNDDNAKNNKKITEFLSNPNNS